MKIELENIISSFGNKLTKHKYDQYIPKLRDYFINYIIENKHEIRSIKELFQYELTKSDILKSTEYYILNNENVRSKGAIDDFLIALNQFFELEINKVYFNQNLVNLRPFTKLNADVEKNLMNAGVHLKDREQFPPINEDICEHIIQFVKNDTGTDFINLQHKIIIELMLLYGFKYDRIRDFEIGHFLGETRILKVKYCKNPLRFINVELPYSLYQNFSKYNEARKTIKFNVNNLFASKSGNLVESSFISYYLKTVKKSYDKNNLNEYLINPFTPTGISKYAIINMILSGMNQSIIMDLTGVEEDIFGACQEHVNDIKEVSKDRYVNSKIRSVKTYDQINGTIK